MEEKLKAWMGIKEGLLKLVLGARKAFMSSLCVVSTQRVGPSERKSLWKRCCEEWPTQRAIGSLLVTPIWKLETANLVTCSRSFHIPRLECGRRKQ